MATSLPPATPSAKTNTMSLISMIAGILGLIGVCVGIIPVLGWICAGLGALLGVVALVLGFIGMNQAKKNGEKGKGMAIAGLVLGALSLFGILLYGAITAMLGPVIGEVFSQINSNLAP
jgi:uncharacterized membrane protein